MLFTVFLYSNGTMPDFSAISSLVTTYLFAIHILPPSSYMFIDIVQTYKNFTKFNRSQGELHVLIFLVRCY